MWTREAWLLGDYSYLQAKKAQSKRKSTFGSLFFLFMGGGLELVLFTFFFKYLCLKIGSFCPTDSEGITYSLCLSAGLFVCSYRQAEVWDPFSQKRSIMGKKDIFHINSILKVVRDRSGLWCSRKNSQLKSMKGWDSKLIARFRP